MRRILGSATIQAMSNPSQVGPHERHALHVLRAYAEVLITKSAFVGRLAEALPIIGGNGGLVFVCHDA
jgi:hypothetical protein